MPKENLPIVAGIIVTTDAIDRFNLNAIHKASGEGGNKAPAQWLRTQSAQELVAEMEKQTMQKCIVSIEGRKGGTYAHEILAVEYAGWIRPDFRIIVNQTFIDYRRGNLTAVQEKKNDYLAEYSASEIGR